MKRHVASVHKGIKHKCSECDAEFTTKESLTDHIKRVHEDKVQKVKCIECDKMFSRKSDMKVHLKRVHNGIKRWVKDQDEEMKVYLNVKIETVDS